jgi:hypothetical protein
MHSRADKTIFGLLSFRHDILALIKLSLLSFCGLQNDYENGLILKGIFKLPWSTKYFHQIFSNAAKHHLWLIA